MGDGIQEGASLIRHSRLLYSVSCLLFPLVTFILHRILV
jgi:hypothetical protein